MALICWMSWSLSRTRSIVESYTMSPTRIAPYLFLPHMSDAMYRDHLSAVRIDHMVLEDIQRRIAIVLVSDLETARMLKDVTECFDQLLSEAIGQVAIW